MNTADEKEYNENVTLAARVTKKQSIRYYSPRCAQHCEACDTLLLHSRDRDKFLTAHQPIRRNTSAHISQNDVLCSYSYDREL